MMKLRFIFLLLFMTLGACTRVVEVGGVIPFDKVKWQTKEGEAYPYRAFMLYDILKNDTLSNLHKDEILNLFGEPSYYREDKDYLHYTISKKKLGLWTLHTRTMVIKMSADTVEWIKVHE